MIKRIDLGCPGHFICVNDCRWRRHTQVGNYRISTVGDLYFNGKEGRQTLGASPDSFFETMVFETRDTPAPKSEDCGCMAVKSFSEIDGKRYATAGEAQCGHEQYVVKY